MTEEQKSKYRDEHRLAYVAEAPVNWCPALGTVLANEEVIDGKSEVGGFPVERKPMRQWMLRITAYGERLLEDLKGIEWSDSLKEMQTNWIGRSEGAEVTFAVAESTKTIVVFTTRPDTLFGATYMVLAPESKLVDQIIPAAWPNNTPDSWKGENKESRSTPAQAIRQYRVTASAKSDLERTELVHEKSGVFTGAYAINPVNGGRIPVWIADYVLATYGTGCIMAVPAHDTRDYEFAQKFDLPIRVVVQAPKGQDSIGFTGDGISVNSGLLDGLETPEAKKKINSWLEEKKLGRKTINFKLRDWLFSRQRYWGEPFPIVWKEGRHRALTEKELPVVPPALDDYKPSGNGEPPLAKATHWVNCADGSFRETNTMPQWAGSCWYYLRYIDARNNRSFCDTHAEHYWMGGQNGGNGKTVPGVDLYVGGTEHAVLHLLYARFWHKILFDLGYVTTPEPFYKLVNQGLILGEDGQKMSKSRGNVVNPDDILVEYGADAFRLYEMFMGPLEMVKPWSTQGVEGVYRFLGRVWRMFIDEKSEQDLEQRQTMTEKPDGTLLNTLRIHPSIKVVEPTTAQLKTLHAAIKKVTEDLDALRMNTAISAMMVFVNEAIGWETKPASVMRDFLILLQPFAPHLTEELWGHLHQCCFNHAGQMAVPSLAFAPWPNFNPAFLVEDVVEIPVQVNGKLRDCIRVAAQATQKEIETMALASEKVQQFIAGKTIKKVIIVPRKIVNIAVS